MAEGAAWDLMIAGIAAARLILIIMLIITPCVVAAVFIVGTVLPRSVWACCSTR